MDAVIDAMMYVQHISPIQRWLESGRIFIQRIAQKKTVGMPGINVASCKAARYARYESMDGRSSLKMQTAVRISRNSSSMKGLWIMLTMPVDKRLVFIIIKRFHMKPMILFSGGLLEVKNAHIPNAHVVILKVPYSNEKSMVLL